MRRAGFDPAEGIVRSCSVAGRQSGREFGDETKPAGSIE
jgi:hypothetical protein